MNLVHETVRGGLKSWRGSFDLPGHVTVTAGQSYKLILEDGRSGMIIVTHVRSPPDPKVRSVEFTGTGRLGRLL